jgi:hypothetical protein
VACANGAADDNARAIGAEGRRETFSQENSIRPGTKTVLLHPINSRRATCLHRAQGASICRRIRTAIALLCPEPVLSARLLQIQSRPQRRKRLRDEKPKAQSRTDIGERPARPLGNRLTVDPQDSRAPGHFSAQGASPIGRFIIGAGARSPVGNDVGVPLAIVVHRPIGISIRAAAYRLMLNCRPMASWMLGSRHRGRGRAEDKRKRKSNSRLVPHCRFSKRCRRPSS